MAVEVGWLSMSGIWCRVGQESGVSKGFVSST